MNFELTGHVIVIGETQQITDKFQKREIVIEQIDPGKVAHYPNYIKAQLTQNQCDLADSIQIGESIKVNFNLKGRKWEKDGKVNYFTNIEIWRIEKINQTNNDESLSNQTHQDANAAVDTILNEQDEEALPF